MQQIMGATVGHSLLPDFHGRPDHFMVQFGRSKISALQDSQGALFERADIGMKGGWLSVAARKANGGIEPSEADNVYLRSIATSKFQ